MGSLRAARWIALHAVAIMGLAACTTAPSDPPTTPPPAVSAPVAGRAVSPPDDAAASASASQLTSALADCPAGMQLVDTEHCPELSRSCQKEELNVPNKITICHRFPERDGRCNGERRRQRFCIDTYEYPNRAGARSPVMVDFYDAMGLCAAEGKRLCWESEWTAACEGPNELPFPYGYVRDAEACNIDNPYIDPSLSRMYSSNAAVQARELARLDQGVPSGERTRCTSGFGVHDQTGNVDEWVMLERARGKGGRAGLKGGAWGHVRNACRPVTTSHAPEFTYYFVSFRCCADAAPASGDGQTVWQPPALPKNPKRPEQIQAGWTPGG